MHVFRLPIRVYSWAFVASSLLFPAQAQIGLFSGHTDVGTVVHAGTVDYDASAKRYTIGGSGENMWFAADNFQYVWTKMSGDVTLSARVSILEKEGDAHRKAVLMIRQSLDPDAPYADVALHGNGLTSLQFRETTGAVTHEIESNVSAPERLRIEKRGETFTMWIGGADGDLRFAGGSTGVSLRGPFYVGIGVCAHNKDEFRKAVFSDVELTAPSQAGVPVLWSTLETITVASTDARVAYAAPGRMDSPAWSPDGAFLFFRQNGQQQRMALTGGKPEPAGAAPSNPPGPSGQQPSPDGRQLAFISRDEDGVDLVLRVKTVEGGKTVTLCRFSGEGGSMDLPSWSPDGLRLAFVSNQFVR
jgi:TolB protein